MHHNWVLVDYKSEVYVYLQLFLSHTSVLWHYVHVLEGLRGNLKVSWLLAFNLGETKGAILNRTLLLLSLLSISLSENLKHVAN